MCALCIYEVIVPLCHAMLGVLVCLPFVLAFSSRRSGVSGVCVFCVSVPCVLCSVMFCAYVQRLSSVYAPCVSVLPVVCYYCVVCVSVCVMSLCGEFGVSCSSVWAKCIVVMCGMCWLAVLPPRLYCRWSCVIVMCKGLILCARALFMLNCVVDVSALRY